MVWQNLLSAEWAIFSFYQWGLETFNKAAFVEAGYPNTTYDRIQEIRDNEAGHLRIFQDQISDTSLKPGACKYQYLFNNPDSFLVLSTFIEIASMAFLTGLVQMAKLPGSQDAMTAIAAVKTRHETFLKLQYHSNIGQDSNGMFRSGPSRSRQAAYVQFQDCADAVTNKSLIPESFRSAVEQGRDGFEWRFDDIAGQADRNACETEIGDVRPTFTVIDYGGDPKEVLGEIVNMSCYTSQWLGPRAQFTIASSFKRSAFLDTFRTTLDMTSKDNESLSCVRAVLTPAAPEPIRLLSLWLPIATFALTCIAACWPAQPPTSSLSPKNAPQLRDRYWAVVRLFLSCFMLPISAWANYQFLDDHIFGYRNSAMAIIILIVLLAGFWWSWTRDSEMGSLVIQSPGRLNKDPESGRQYYALVLFCLMFLRGSVIGGLQTYTSVQLGVLLGCELVKLLSMTFWTRFACFISLTGILSVSRLALFALHIGFVPGLASHSGTMLIAYIILCGHVTVLAFIFLLPAVLDMAHLMMCGRAVTMSDAPVREFPSPPRRAQTDIEGLQKSESAKNGDSNSSTRASSPDFNQLLFEVILKRETNSPLIVPSSQKAVVEFLGDLKGRDKRAEFEKNPTDFSDSSSTLIDSKSSKEEIAPIADILVVDLVSYLFSKENSAISSTPLRHDLDHPINEYFISSSHNTYLRGRQVAARSKLKGYIATLSQGCRSVEIDCWDGRDGQPIVKHGYSLTTSISFRSVIETINNYAFFSSDLPLWLSLEIHCNPAQRDIMARTMLEIFRSSLVVEPLDASAQKLPSPNQLRGKILLKVKVARDPQPLQESLAPEYLDLDGIREDVENGDHQDLPCDLLQSLAVYGASRRLPKDAEFDTYRNFIYSVSEGNFKKRTKDNGSLELAGTHHLVRVYPDPNRVDSSNFNPVQCWKHGVQMAALNFQTNDFYMSLNEAMFRGSSGYLLKAPPQPTLIRLQVDVLMAWGLKVSSGNCRVYVKMKLLTPDTMSQKARSRSVPLQESDVVFDENLEMSTETNYPHLTFMEWSVKTISNGRSMSMASGIAKIDNLKEGYRYLPLAIEMIMISS
ncbi:1-phosphatidylinositol-4,5-bisphosphate phosphodiesterase 1 [Fusarium agapanthi]|uniref:Phosphoinositide phospholipase C n=1 Tax=Fusarium agapanthi TaxID=1803897 RepID=A0A9P5EAD3_9HYPO|nr:1-phosphatidylinositol-4,5-bisphosphate phosphodiesterase 1 [Fusarium agapanthi]